MLTLMLMYVPERTSDGKHGFTEAYKTPVEIYASLKVHEGEIKLTFQAGHPVLIGNVIEVEAQYYRVTGLVSNPMAPKRAATLEATTKPIVPGS